jgi:beta-glucanase (GH16 family)
MQHGRPRPRHAARRARRTHGLLVAMVFTVVTGLVCAGLLAYFDRSALPLTCLAKPDATNTGAVGRRQISNVSTLFQPDSRLINAKLKRALTVSGDGSVIRNVSVDGPITVTGQRVTLDRVTATSIIASDASQLTVSHSNLAGGETAVDITADGRAAGEVSGIKLVGNYIHGSAPNKLVSYSGTRLRGTKGVMISCSNYDLGGSGIAAIYMEDGNGTANTVVVNNWLSGGKFAIVTEATQVVLKRNIFAPVAQSSICRTVGQPINQDRNRMADGTPVQPCSVSTQGPSEAGSPTPQETLTTPGAQAASSAPTSSNPQTAHDGTEAAVLNGWGPVIAGDEFNYTGAPKKVKWKVYDAKGNAGKGRRKPAAWKVNESVARVTGDSSGTTGGMAAKFGRQKFGRWEVRMRTNVRDPEYHPVLLLWPDSKNWPCDGEIDYGEGGKTTSLAHFYLHYGCHNKQVHATKTIDTTQWHNFAVDWQPHEITGYIDGIEWFRSTKARHQPPGPMHQTVQLDWFPDGTKLHKSWMEVAWVRVYDRHPSGSTPSSTSATTPQGEGPPPGHVVTSGARRLNPQN